MKKTGTVSSYKKLRRKHRAEWRRIQLFEQVDMQVLFDNKRLDYERLQTEEERATMLKTYTQQMLQLKEVYTQRRKLLSDRQEQQLASLNITNAGCIKLSLPLKTRRSGMTSRVVTNRISPL